MGTIPRRFRRHDGVEGVGFWIVWAGIQQASVSWPDGPAVRYTEDQVGKDIDDCGLLFPEITLSSDGEGGVYSDGKLIQAACGSESETELTQNISIEPFSPPSFQPIAEYVAKNPEAPIAQVIEHLETNDVHVTPTEVATVQEATLPPPAVEAEVASEVSFSEPSQLPL